MTETTKIDEKQPYNKEGSGIIEENTTENESLNMLLLRPLRRTRMLPKPGSAEVQILQY